MVADGDNRNEKYLAAELEQRNPLAEEACELAYSAPQQQPDGPDFSEADAADRAAEGRWQTLKEAEGADLTIIKEFMNCTGKAAIKRLTAPGGLDVKKTSGYIADNLRTLDIMDPDRETRIVPGTPPVKALKDMSVNEIQKMCSSSHPAAREAIKQMVKDDAGNSAKLSPEIIQLVKDTSTTAPSNKEYTTRYMQITNLACRSVDADDAIEMDGDLVPMQLAEIAWRGGKTFDKESNRKLHASAQAKLESTVFDKNKAYPADEWPDERKKIAARAGLSESEVEALRKRWETAKAELAKP